jgi:mono/diheme cytochrome c family protein
MIVRPTAAVLAAMLTMIATTRSLGAQTPPAGKAAYERVCRVCHGADARGDAAPALVPLEHDLDEVMAIVREGRGQMPPIAPNRLTDDEIRQIVAYLKSLEATPPAAGRQQVAGRARAN